MNLSFPITPPSSQQAPANPPRLRCDYVHDAANTNGVAMIPNLRGSDVLSRPLQPRARPSAEGGAFFQVPPLTREEIAQLVRNNDFHPALGLALSMQTAEVVEDFLRYRPQVTDGPLSIAPWREILAAENNLYFRKAAGLGNVKLLNLLLDLPPEFGIDPSVNNGKPMRNAISFNRVDVVKLLLQRKGRGIELSEAMLSTIDISQMDDELRIIAELSHLINTSQDPDDETRHLPIHDVLRMASCRGQMESYLRRDPRDGRNFMIQSVLETPGMGPTIEKFIQFYGITNHPIPEWLGVLQNLNLPAKSSEFRQAIENASIIIDGSPLPSEVCEEILTCIYPGMSNIYA